MGQSEMNQQPPNEIRIKINRSLLASLFQMAAQTQITMGVEDAEAAKVVEAHCSQIIEASIAEFRLQQLLNKRSGTKQNKTTRGSRAAPDAPYDNNRKKVPPAVVQRILHA